MLGRLARYDVIKGAMAGPTARPLSSSEYMVAAALGGPCPYPRLYTHLPPASPAARLV
jgi:hypothetical protein